MGFRETCSHLLRGLQLTGRWAARCRAYNFLAFRIQGLGLGGLLKNPLKELVKKKRGGLYRRLNTYRV